VFYLSAAQFLLYEGENSAADPFTPERFQDSHPFYLSLIGGLEPKPGRANDYVPVSGNNMYRFVIKAIVLKGFGDTLLLDEDQSPDLKGTPQFSVVGDQFAGEIIHNRNPL
jgi:hypothetical protein